MGIKKSPGNFLYRARFTFYRYFLAGAVDLRVNLVFANFIKDHNLAKFKNESINFIIKYFCISINEEINKFETKNVSKNFVRNVEKKHVKKIKRIIKIRADSY